jgi:DNA-binding MarR family transcriptional regulator
LVRERGLQEADRPLSWTQRLALAIAVDESPLRLRALAARMGTTDATASRTVDSLAAIGFLRRESDPSDGRGVLVVATPEAVALLAERRERLVDALAHGLAGMSDEDQGRLVLLLDELSGVLESSAKTSGLGGTI